MFSNGNSSKHIASMTLILHTPREQKKSQNTLNSFYEASITMIPSPVKDKQERKIKSQSLS
jgi:hypothetical protein